jgi:hypothetical protein
MGFSIIRESTMAGISAIVPIGVVWTILGEAAENDDAFEAEKKKKERISECKV